MFKGPHKISDFEVVSVEETFNTLEDAARGTDPKFSHAVMVALLRWGAMKYNADGILLECAKA